MSSIPESAEVRAERAKHFEPPDLSGVRDWFNKLDQHDVVKYYMAALLVLMALSLVGSGIKAVVEWCINYAKKEDK